MIEEIGKTISGPGKFGVSFLMRPSPLLKFPFDVPMRDKERKPTIVRVEECVQDVGGTEIPTGLRMRTVVEGKSLADSIERAGYLAEKVAHTCSLVSNQGTPIVQLETAYQAGEVRKRLSLFLVDLPMPHMPRREIDVRAAIEALEGIEDSARSDQMSGVHRSLMWYRKAITTRDLHDQMLWLWFGLESLDSVLTRNLGLERGKDRGIKHQFGKLAAEGRRTYEKSKQLRHRIAHPIEGEMPNLSESESLSPKVAAVLRTSLAKIVGIGIEDSRLFPMLQPENPMQVSVLGWIHDKIGALDFMSKEAPRIEFRGFKADIKIGRKKPTEIWSDVKVKYQGPDGTSVKQIGIGMKDLQYGRLIKSGEAI